MTTLIGNEVFEYLGHLNSEVEKLKSDYEIRDFRYQMHQQMQNILLAEEKFLREVHKDQAMLSFSGNGLPTTESLKPDLETIVKLSEEHKLFRDIAETYKISGKEDEINYKTMSENEWLNLLKDKSKLIEKNSFEINETNDGKLELNVAKKIYVNSIDEFSKKYPIAMINGKTMYQVAWGRLFSESSQEFLGTSYDLVKLNKELKTSPINLINFNTELDIGNLEMYDFANKPKVIVNYLAEVLARKFPEKLFEIKNNGSLFERIESQNPFFWKFKKTTIIGDELFEYIEHLQGEVDKRISTNQEGSLSYLMHSQMRDIVIAERDFLKYINSNGTQPILSISPNGLPSVNSLNPDLEKICELAENKSSFSDITQKFRKGIHGKNKEEGNIYTSVSEQEWNKELSNRNKEKLNSQIGFAFSETDEGKFELALREDFYLQVYDQHSKEFPVLIREGKMNYHVVWNKLIDNSEENFYVPNTALVLSNNGFKQQTFP